MRFLPAKEAAAQWNMSLQQVDALCQNGQIPGAYQNNSGWMLPADLPRSKSLPISRPLLKPFIKWAGGKNHLLASIRKQYPAGLGSEITRYAEPFVGGGAVLLDLLSRYSLEEVYINDINPELIRTYEAIRDHVSSLIEQLSAMQQNYLPLDSEHRRIYYYQKRERYNALLLEQSSKQKLEKAALFLFLNKTCFNGLYRVNRKGLFNVPMGDYKAPCICDSENLLRISQAIQHVTMTCGDYRQAAKFIDAHTFVYFDPPYRPLSPTANFTSYSEHAFGDQQQAELARFFAEMAAVGARVLLSNSDPKNADPDDTFLDDLYQDFQIHRIQAARFINSKGSGRGKISELLISNG